MTDFLQPIRLPRDDWQIRARQFFDEVVRACDARSAFVDLSPWVRENWSLRAREFALDLRSPWVFPARIIGSIDCTKCRRAWDIDGWIQSDRRMSISVHVTCTCPRLLGPVSVVDPGPSEAQPGEPKP